MGKTKQRRNRSRRSRTKQDLGPLHDLGALLARLHDKGMRRKTARRAYKKRRQAGGDDDDEGGALQTASSSLGRDDKNLEKKALGWFNSFKDAASGMLKDNDKTATHHPATHHPATHHPATHHPATHHPIGGKRRKSHKKRKSKRHRRKSKKH